MIYICAIYTNIFFHRHMLKFGTPMIHNGGQNKKVNSMAALIQFILCLWTMWVLTPAVYIIICAGMVGISLSGDWGEPVDISNQKDIEAAERYVQFYMGWFATPIFHGDYPQVMKDFVGRLKCKQSISWATSVFNVVTKLLLVVTVCAGRKSVQQGLGTSRLPTFSPQEKSYIKGTCDFLGIGHFTTRYITQKNNPSTRSSSSYFGDRDLAELVDPRWPDPGSEWLYSVPWGFRRLLNFVKVTEKEWHGQ